MYDFARIQQLPLTVVLPTVVVEGTFQAHIRRLTDVMNDPENAQLVLTDATFTDVMTGRTSPRMALARIDTREALIAHTTVPTDGSEQQRNSKRPIRAILMIPPFTIRGAVHLVHDGALRTSIMSLTDRWIPVTDATYHAGGSPLGPRPVELIVVNNSKAHIAIATEDEWNDAPAGSRLQNAGASPW